MTFRIHRLRRLLARPSSRALVWFVVAALLMGSATRFGFHSHADDDGQHGHHHSFPALVDLHGASGSDPTGVDDPSAALLHGHDFASAATLTVAAPVPCLACAPAARVLPPPASPPDARASAPPIRPPIA